MEEVKRVLCLVSAMNTGGAETFLMKIYRNLDRTKYQMDFCVNVKEKGFYDDEIKRLGGRIFVIPSKSENIKKFKSELAEIIRSHQYANVFRITSNAMGFLDLKIAKDSGAKRCIARSSNSSDGAGIKVLLVHKLGQLLYERYVDVKIAPSDLAAEYTFGKKALKHKEVTILHNAVDLEQYSYGESNRTKFRDELGISEKTMLIGHVGRFSMQKNHEFLIDIYQKICQYVPDSRLILVGNGELQEEVRKKVNGLNLSEKVIFLGVRADISSILSGMDVFAFPSFYEGMPNTVIEAQATGLPCVIADTITKEANITGLVKYISLQESVNEWAKAVIDSVSPHRKDTKEMFIQNGYDINTVTKQFETLIFE